MSCGINRVLYSKSEFSSQEFVIVCWVADVLIAVRKVHSPTRRPSRRLREGLVHIRDRTCRELENTAAQLTENFNKYVVLLVEIVETAAGNSQNTSATPSHTDKTRCVRSHNNENQQYRGSESE